MEKQSLIQIELIEPNPYQPRQVEDLAVVEEIAASIKHNGLMQVPTARRVNGTVQLAFGHTRLAAFKLNGEKSMPLIIRDLTDLQMFELGVAENIKRRDLNPIEQAQAMRRYMQEFGKNSVETGGFFNVSAEKVRNTIRLLNLPATLQAGVADGTYNQHNARRLLTIQRVAPKDVEKVANKLKGDADPDHVISEALKNTGNSVEMWQRYQSGEPKAGHNLWPLRTPAEAFPQKHLPELRPADVVKSLEIEKHEELGKWIGWLRMGFIHGPMAPNDKQPDETVADYLIRKGAPEAVIERIVHLLNPPGCTSCPLYAKVDGSHYCTFKLCHSRKSHAWEIDTIETASKKLKIAIYDAKTDGKDFAYISSWDEADKKLFEKRNADLRLRKGTNWSQRFEGMPDGFSIIVIGETLKKKRKAAKASQTESNGRAQGQSQEEYMAEQKRLRVLREARGTAVLDFLWNVATPVFQTVMSGVTNVDFLNLFADRVVRGVPAEEPGKKATKAAKAEFYRRAIIFSLLDDDLWDISQKAKPVSAMAKQLQGVATTWGVKLPKNWMAVAAEADKGIKVPAEEEGKA
jgi:ParB family chromosome partitioning protein